MVIYIPPLSPGILHSSDLLKWQLTAAPLEYPHLTAPQIESLSWVLSIGTLHFSLCHIGRISYPRLPPPRKPWMRKSGIIPMASLCWRAWRRCTATRSGRTERRQGTPGLHLSSPWIGSGRDLEDFGLEMGLSENGVPRKTQWFMIIIPTKWL